MAAKEPHSNKAGKASGEHAAADKVERVKRKLHFDMDSTGREMHTGESSEPEFKKRLEDNFE